MRTCAFCSSTEDLMACSWPVQDFVASTYGQLAVGDQVKRIADKTGHPAATVVSLEAWCMEWIVDRDVNGGKPYCGRTPLPFPMDGSFRAAYHYIRARMTVILRKANGKEITREVYMRSPVQVIRDTVCGALACECHRCERGPNATRCARHWTMLRAVA